MARKVAIFWDYGSCPAPKSVGVTGHTIAAHLRREGKIHGNITSFKAYFGLPSYDPAPRPTLPQLGIRSELNAEGVSIVDASQAGLSTLATDLLCFALDNVDTPHQLIVVSGNPNLVYTLSALEARNHNIGLVVPSGQRAEPLSAHGRVLHRWERLAKGNFNTFASDIKTLPKKEEPDGMKLDNKLLARGEDDGYDPCEPIDVDECESTIEDEAQSSDVELIEVEEPAPAPARAPAPAPAGAPAYQLVQQPLFQPLFLNFQTYHFARQTTIHKLRLLETDPLVLQLFADPEAVKIKGWRRQLKAAFYFISLKQDSKLPQTLESLFTDIEGYDMMTKNYLAFSKFGKLMTQIAQHWCADYDFRFSYTSRAKTLVLKWEKLVDSNA